MSCIHSLPALIDRIVIYKDGKCHEHSVKIRSTSEKHHCKQSGKREVKMHSSLNAHILLTALLAASACIAHAAPKFASRVYNYQGSLSIKDDMTGQIIRDTNSTSDQTTDAPSDDLTEQEAACWKQIVESSGECSGGSNP